jgi:hypothetical protein
LISGDGKKFFHWNQQWTLRNGNQNFQMLFIIFFWTFSLFFYYKTTISYLKKLYFSYFFVLQIHHHSYSSTVDLCTILYALLSYKYIFFLFLVCFVFMYMYVYILCLVKVSQWVCDAPDRRFYWFLLILVKLVIDLISLLVFRAYIT